MVDPQLEPINVESEIRAQVERMLNNVAPVFGLKKHNKSRTAWHYNKVLCYIEVRGDAIYVYRGWQQRNNKFSSFVSKWNTVPLTLDTWDSGVRQAVAKFCELIQGLSLESVEAEDTWFD